jgi:hypothetical protein
VSDEPVAETVAANGVTDSDTGTQTAAATETEEATTDA